MLCCVSLLVPSCNDAPLPMASRERQERAAVTGVEVKPQCNENPPSPPAHAARSGRCATARACGGAARGSKGHLATNLGYDHVSMRVFFSGNGDARRSALCATPNASCKLHHVGRWVLSSLVLESLCAGGWALVLVRCGGRTRVARSRSHQDQRRGNKIGNPKVHGKRPLRVGSPLSVGCWLPFGPTTLLSLSLCLGSI